MAWLELTIATAAEAVDWVSTLLAAHGFRDEVQVLEPAAPADRRWPFELRFYLPDDREGRGLAGSLAEALDDDPPSVAAAVETARLNGVEGSVRVELGSLGAGAQLGHWMGWTELGPPVILSGAKDPPPAIHTPNETFDLIAANILGRVHL